MICHSPGIEISPGANRTTGDSNGAFFCRLIRSPILFSFKPANAPTSGFRSLALSSPFASFLLPVLSACQMGLSRMCCKVSFIFSLLQRCKILMAKRLIRVNDLVATTTKYLRTLIQPPLREINRQVKAPPPSGCEC